MLQELTKEQERLCDKVAKKYLGLLKKHTEPERHMSDIQAWLRVVYQDLFSLPSVPQITVCDSPYSALTLAGQLVGKEITTTDYCGVSDAGWVSFYDYFHRVGQLNDAEYHNVRLLSNYMRCVWDSVLLDGRAIVIRYPDTICTDEQGNLHCSSGPAVSWRDGECEWFWHGVSVDERLVMRPSSYTSAEYKAISSTELRRALGESMGWDDVVILLGATVCDSWTDPDTGLLYELLTDGEQKWLRKQSPRIATGEQPTYIEPVHEDLATAAGARKWQATSLTPRECDADHCLIYGVET